MPNPGNRKVWDCSDRAIISGGVVLLLVLCTVVAVCAEAGHCLRRLGCFVRSLQ